MIWKEKFMQWLFPPTIPPHQDGADASSPDEVDFQQAIQEHDREMRLIEELVSTYRRQPPSSQQPRPIPETR